MKKLIIFASLISLIFNIHAAHAVVMDDVLEACFKSGLKQAGRNADEIADVARKTAGSFSRILGSDVDYIADITKHSRYADDFLDVARQGRRVDDVSDIARQSRRIDNINDTVRQSRRIDNINDTARQGRRIDDVSDAAKQSRRVDNINDAAKQGRRIDDMADLSGLNAKQLNDFKNLSRGERALALSMQDFARHIGKMPEGAEMLATVGKKGILLGTVYGDEAVMSVYKLKKGGALSLISNAHRINADELSKLIKQAKLDNIIDVKAIKRLNIFVIDEADFMKNIVKRLGKNGAKNIADFCVNAAKRAVGYAMDNPVKVLTGAIILTALTKPEILVDAAGNIVHNTVEVLGVGLVQVGGAAAGAVMSLPAVAGDAMIERFMGGAPEFIKMIIKPFAAFIIIMGALYFFNFTRFIPRCVFSCIGSLLSLAYARLTRKKVLPASDKKHA